MPIPLFCDNALLEQNQLLLQKLIKSADIILVEQPQACPFLIIEQGQLGLANELWPAVLPVFVDFVSGALNHRRLHGGGVGQAVAKAVGLKKRRDLCIVDGTAGLGRDAFVLASLGATVHLFERNPIVQFILQDGLDRLAVSSESEMHDINLRMKFYSESLQNSWQAINGIEPDVIYLDPMFPDRTKTAKVKKDMALFHDVVGSDEDADQLLEQALEVARFRVVVKRSRNAPHLANLAPTMMQTGKSSRFDVYSKKAIS